jgi:hypothetical protein
VLEQALELGLDDLKTTECEADVGYSERSSI